ncbi:hypothetical protein FN846DRAFT_986313, partial [Sphaerosporella brunnea]
MIHPKAPRDGEKTLALHYRVKASGINITPTWGTSGVIFFGLTHSKWGSPFNGECDGYVQAWSLKLVGADWCCGREIFRVHFAVARRVDSTRTVRAQSPDRSETVIWLLYFKNCWQYMCILEKKTGSRAAQTGVFDLDIRIFNRLFIDVCKQFDAETGLKSINVEKNKNACLSGP